jgi:protein-disulfide isomerase
VVCIWGLAGIGAWISGELVKQHASLWNGAGDSIGLLGRLCHAAHSARFDCGAALKSEWAEVRLPVPAWSPSLGFSVRTIVVPAAFGGLAYFVFIMVWFMLIGGPRPGGPRWQSLPRLAGRCAALTSLFFVGVMALGFAPWCASCCLAHAVNCAMVLLIGRLHGGDPGDGDLTAVLETRFHEYDLLARRTPTHGDAARAIGVAIVLVAGLWQYHRAHLAFKGHLNALRPYRAMVASLREDPVFLLREFHAQPRYAIPPRAGESVSGPPPQLVVFTDFECPACHCNAQAMDRIREPFGGRLRVSVRHFPLCQACNDRVKTGAHRHACDAARAAEAARRLGGEDAFQKMHDLLFENRKKLSRPLYRELALRIGLNAQRFLDEMDGEAVRRAVQADIGLAGALGVTGTPAMFLNGRRIPAILDGPVFWKAVADDGGRE